MPALARALLAGAGGFQGHSLLFFAISLLVVAAGIGLFTWAGDVDTQLGASSSLAARGGGGPEGLPVVYHRVPTVGDSAASARAPRLPLPSLSSSGKGAQLGRAALEAVQRQQAAAGTGGGVAGAAGTAGATGQPLSNPFDLAAPGVRTPSPASAAPLSPAADEEGVAAAAAAVGPALPGPAAGTAVQLSTSPRFVAPGSAAAQTARTALAGGEEQ